MLTSGPDETGNTQPAQCVEGKTTESCIIQPIDTDIRKNKCLDANHLPGQYFYKANNSKCENEFCHSFETPCGPGQEQGDHCNTITECNPDYFASAPTRMPTPSSGFPRVNYVGGRCFCATNLSDNISATDVCDLE